MTGLVAFGGCDKTLPGAMMGLVRCNVPGVFLFRRRALPGRFQGRDVTVLDAYEGRRRGADRRDERGRSSRCSSAPASRASAPAPDSSPPTRWRWWRKRSAHRAEFRDGAGVYSQRLAIAKRAGES
jgi:dihydroxy-acid dehydratase